MVSTLLLFINTKAQLINEQFEVIVSGCDDFPVSSSHNRMIAYLSTSHEKADTKIVMHALYAHAQGFERVVVNTRDTDILILLIHN